MAVPDASLGQHVRCPHCQGVVVATAVQPTAPAAAAPKPNALASSEGEPGVEATFLVSPREEVESIFTPPEFTLDDILGDGAAPRVELPSEEPVAGPGPAAVAPDEPVAAPAATDFPGQPPPASPPEAFPPPAQSGGITSSEPATTEGETLPLSGLDSPRADADEPLAALGDEELPSPPVLRSAPRPSRSASWLFALVIVPLISYSILSTAMIALLLQRPTSPNSLEILPDLEGDNRGATRLKPKTLRYPVPPPETTPVPPHLRGSLNQTIVVGDLEVTPLRVVQKRISFRTGENGIPEPAPEDCLALYLHLRNRSEDVVFKPLDRFFTRWWKASGSGEVPPFTILEMGSKKFYGGPIKWAPSVGEEEQRREAIETIIGQDLDRELKPGEEMTTFICTDPADHAVKALASYQGPLLWRVQVRRGLVKWRTSRGSDREDPATTVVGIDFHAQDVSAETE
jgi:hypothetical protein